MNVYIAGKYTAKDRLKVERDRIRALGFECPSTWMDETHTDYTASEELMVENAKRDLEEVGEADWLIIDTQDMSNTGGREVELGYAFSIGIHVSLVGPKRNIFHALITDCVKDWDALFRRLGPEDVVLPSMPPGIVDFEGEGDGKVAGTD